MSWAKINQSTRSLLFAVAAIGLTAIGLWIGAQSNTAEANTTVVSQNSAPAATFAGTNVGLIPDHTGTCQTAPFNAGRNVNFAVTGLSGAVTNVEISTTFGGPNHTWIGDVTATLIAPNGASHTIFGRTLATTAGSSGDDTDLGGPYVFKDSAAAPPNGGWWQTANILGAAVPMTVGDYRTTNSGGAGATIPMPPTAMNASFTGVSNANGTWMLRLLDGCALDTGAISAATLTVTTGAPPVAADANVDMSGDGRTDWVVARGTNTPLTEADSTGEASINQGVDSVRERMRLKYEKGGSTEGVGPPIYWYVSINGSGATGVGQLGDDVTTDFITPEDFDGDGKDDLAVWTPGPPTQAKFKILQSSNNTVRVELFGQEGDDPAVVGDYDGDNKADPAVYRCPAFMSGDGQCYFFFRGSFNNPSGNVTYVPWGFGEEFDFFPNIGDFDGDGKYDFCVQRANPASPNNGQFVLLKSSNLGVEYINWGNSTDIIVPGDYDGDGLADFAVSRTNVSSQREYYILERDGGGTGGTPIFWGIPGDVRVPGDYDGDNKTDIAIWRGNADPSQNFFWVRRSSDGGTTQIEWGQCPSVTTCDYPVANWAVH